MQQLWSPGDNGGPHNGYRTASYSPGQAAAQCSVDLTWPWVETAVLSWEIYPGEVYEGLSRSKQRKEWEKHTLLLLLLLSRVSRVISVRPHRQQPTRLLCPWDSPGKNTGVGCHCLLRKNALSRYQIILQQHPQTPEEKSFLRTKKEEGRQSEILWFKPRYGN